MENTASQATFYLLYHEAEGKNTILHFTSQL